MSSRLWFGVRAALGVLAIGVAGVVAARYIEHRNQARWDERVADIATFVEQRRGLLFDHPVDVEFVSEQNFVNIFDTSGYELDTELAADFATRSRLHDAAGFGSEVDLFESGASVTELSSLGFYVPTEDRIYIRGTTLTPAVRAVVAHELTHALQAQHFDLEMGGPDDVARRSIIEADAMRVEEQFVLTMSRADQQAVDIGYALSDEEAAALDEAPTMLVNRQFAPYVLGPMLVGEVFRAEGNVGVDALIRRPPTEEVLIDPTLYRSGQTEEAPAIEAPAGAVVIDEPRPASMLDMLSMLDAWLPWTQARGAVDGWAGGTYVSYELGGGDRIACFAVSIAFDGPTDRFVDAVVAWATASGSTAQPVEARGRVEFEACERGADAPEPPATIVPTLHAIAFEHSALATLDPNAAPDLVAGMRCVSRALVDDPSAGSWLVRADLSPEHEAEYEHARLAAHRGCGLDPSATAQRSPPGG